MAVAPVFTRGQILFGRKQRHPAYDEITEVMKSMPNERILKEKQRIVEDLTGKLKSQAGVLINYSGITVNEDTEMRVKMREANVDYTVVKNTLMRFAIKNVGFEALEPILNGTTSLAVSTDDPVAPARIIKEYVDKFANYFEIKGGFMDGRILSVDEVNSLAAIPPLPILRAKVLGTLLAPITSLAVVLDQIAKKGCAPVDAELEAPAEEAAPVEVAVEAVTETVEEAAPTAPAEEPAPVETPVEEAAETAEEPVTPVEAVAEVMPEAPAEEVTPIETPVEAVVNVAEEPVEEAATEVPAAAPDEEPVPAEAPVEAVAETVEDATPAVSVEEPAPAEPEEEQKPKTAAKKPAAKKATGKGEPEVPEGVPGITEDAAEAKPKTAAKKPAAKKETGKDEPVVPEGEPDTIEDAAEAKPETAAKKTAAKKPAAKPAAKAPPEESPPAD